MAVLCAVERLNCKRCQPRNNTAEELDRVEKLRERQGCEQPTSFPQYSDTETGQNYYRCPVSQLTRQSLAILEVLNMMELGFLPKAGGVLDQDAQLMARVRVAKYHMTQAINEKK